MDPWLPPGRAAFSSFSPGVERKAPALEGEGIEMETPGRIRALTPAVLVSLLLFGCEGPSPTGAPDDLAPAYGTAASQRGYQPVDLGTLGGSESWAYAINNRGQVVGWSETENGDTHAFLWEKGRMVDLGSPHHALSRAMDINERGQVVGL